MNFFSTRISVAIQHHPARAHLIDALASHFTDPDIVEDPDPAHGSPLRTYIEALRRTPSWATHRLVIQDDALPCRDFEVLMQEAVEAKPGALVCFFTPGTAPHRRRVVAAAQAGERWAQLRGTWYPTVATCWPVEQAARFVEWCETPGRWKGREQRGDDGPLGQWASHARAAVWATVPSLVQHPDVEPSLIGRKAAAGRNRARVAALYEG